MDTTTKDTPAPLAQGETNKARSPMEELRDRWDNRHATPEEHEALKRLIVYALRGTGQGRRVANFLLAWWNAEECGGFDLVETWALDFKIQDDVVRVFEMMRRGGTYPCTLGYSKEFGQIVRLWRPELCKDAR